MIKKNAVVLMYVFIFAGLLVAGWSLLNHYRKDGVSGCNVNRTFDCDIVNKGLYSEIGGFPVAAIGVVGYAVLAVIALFWRKEKDPMMLKALIAFAVAGLLFSAYLSYIEGFVLYTWCLLCLASLSCILGTTLTASLAHPPKAPPAHKP